MNAIYHWPSDPPDIRVALFKICLAIFKKAVMFTRYQFHLNSRQWDPSFEPNILSWRRRLCAGTGTMKLVENRQSRKMSPWGKDKLKPNLRLSTAFSPEITHLFCWIAPVASTLTMPGKSLCKFDDTWKETEGWAKVSKLYIGPSCLLGIPFFGRCLVSNAYSRSDLGRWGAWPGYVHWW